MGARNLKLSKYKLTSVFVILSHYIACTHYAMFSTMQNCIFSIKEVQSLAQWCVYVDGTAAIVTGNGRTDGEHRSKLCTFVLLLGT